MAKHKTNIRLVKLIRGLDLRMSLSDKYQEVDQTGSATVLMNRKHTLAHVIYPGEYEILTRFPFSKDVSISLRRSSDAYIKGFLMLRFERFL